MAKTSKPAEETQQVKPRRDPFRHLECPEWGKGGQYIEGPDGKRRPVTPPPAEVATEFPAEAKE